MPKPKNRDKQILETLRLIVKMLKEIQLSLDISGK